MTTMIDDRPAELTETIAQHLGGDLAEVELIPIRRALEGLVDEFEERRSDQIAERGVAVVAAYDTGIKYSVHEAIDELNAGCYGYCITCSNSISVGRLRSVPYARRCADCQYQEERRWNEAEHLFAGFIRQWVGEPQGPTVRVRRQLGSPAPLGRAVLPLTGARRTRTQPSHRGVRCC